jgi:HEAT repeat protein
MRAARVFGLLILALVLVALTVTDVPAQIPGVKVQPGIKPGLPPVPPVVPKVPMNPGKNPIPVPPGGSPAPQPGTSPGTSPGVAPPGGAPEKKRDRGKWPEKINDKTVDDCVREMRSNSDPAVRESAVRTLPLYGPVGRDKGAENLIYAMTKDQDINVRVAAVGVAPTVLLAYADGPDQPLMDGLTAIMNLLDSESIHLRQEAVMAVAACGPYMKQAKPGVVSKLVFRTRESSSYQLRRAAVAALAILGQGVAPTMEGGKGLDPDTGAVNALLDVLRSDNCALVRREAVNGLIAMGPVAQSQQKQWRTALDNVFKPGTEKDKGVQLWVRVLIIRNDPAGLKGNEGHLNAIADMLQSKEAPVQVDACQALGVLGEDAKTKLQGLIDLINTPTEEPVVVAAAMMAAAQMKSQAAIVMPVLQQKGLNHLNQDVRKVAQEAIELLNGRKK